MHPIPLDVKHYSLAHVCIERQHLLRYSFLHAPYVFYQMGTETFQGCNIFFLNDLFEIQIFFGHPKLFAI